MKVGGWRLSPCHHVYFILSVYLPHIHTHTNERRRKNDVEMGLMDIRSPRS